MADEKADEVTGDKAPKPQVELTDAEVIARRSADIDAAEAKDSEHVKVFVLPPGNKPTEANGFDHQPNKDATRQYAISQGLRPLGDVRFVSAKQVGKAKAWWLTYAVKVAPAERVDWPEGVVAVTEHDQHELEARRADEQPEDESSSDKPTE